MDECKDAGDSQRCQGRKEIQTMATRDKTVTDQVPLRDSGETIDNKFKFRKGRVHSDSPTTIDMDEDGSSVDPPIFKRSCSGAPHISNFHFCPTHSHEDHISSENEGARHLPSDVFACGGNDQISDDAFSFSNFSTNVKMEVESSLSVFRDQDKDIAPYLDLQKCCEHNLLLNDENSSALPDTRPWDLNVDECDVDQDKNNSQKMAFNSTLGDFGGLTLDDLDDDAIFHIASLMEARSLKFGLSPSCQRFQTMFDNEAYWRARVNTKWQRKYPAVNAPEDFCWDDACIRSEDSQRVWTDPDSHMHHFMYTSNVYGEVDSVHLMQNGKFLMSGDRNRNMNLINLSKYNPGCGPPSEAEMDDMLAMSNSTIHKGWIWSIASVGNHAITGSWDTRIRVFDLNASIQNFSAYKCRSAVLSLYAEDKEIIASCFDKKVYFFDRRTSECSGRVFHKQAVMSVTGNQDYVISGSEDKTIVVFDRRAGKIFKTIKLDAYSLCLSFHDNQLWFGDKSGLIHLYDANAGMFSHVGTYDVGHKDKVTGIIYTPGSIFTCSGDKSLKVLTPTRDPVVMKSLGAHNKELAKIDHSCGVLASAGGDESIGVWLPKQWGQDSYLL